MPATEPITAWAVTTGESGMRAQARGLALAVADQVVEKTVRLAAPWRWLPRQLGGNPLERLDPGLDSLAPPWPDLVVSCGRRAAILAAAVRRESRGRTLAVHIQDPRIPPERFDLVIALGHDSIAASGNVIKTLTALHDVTPEALASAAATWRGRFERLGHPLAGVAIGGTMRRRPFRVSDARRLVDGLRTLRRAGYSLAITPSRRTPPRVLAVVAAAFADDGNVFIWDRVGANPYVGILALADRLIVSSDSVSMISEALAAGPPVEVFDLGVLRHELFLDALVAKRLVRRFLGEVDAPLLSGPADATPSAAEAVKALLQARTGVEG